MSMNRYSQDAAKIANRVLQRPGAAGPNPPSQARLGASREPSFPRLASVNVCTLCRNTESPRQATSYNDSCILPIQDPQAVTPRE
jgi:hypothetical protein